MNKSGYQSGFLYHPDTQQILLQKDSVDSASPWTLLETSGGGNFHQVVADLLNINLNAQVIFSVYDYAAGGKKHFIFYAEVSKTSDFPKFNNHVFAWFTAREIIKLPLSSQTKQDIIVGRRVIDSASRRKAGEFTIG